MVFGEPAQVQAFRDMATAFERQNPGVRVNLNAIAGSEEEYHARLAVDLAGSTPADVVLLDYDAVAQYYTRGAFQALTRRMQDSRLIKPDDFYPQAYQAYQWQGEQMCLPINVSSLVIYYNKALFDAAGLDYPRAGWTWDEFLRTGQALTKEAAGDSTSRQFGAFIAPELKSVLPFVWQNGGNLLSADGEKLALADPAALEALQFVVDWQAKYQIVPNAEEIQAQDASSRFQNGEIAMYFASRAATPGFRVITGFDWDVGPLPQKAQAANILRSDGLCLPAKASHPDLGWKLMEFALSASGQQIMAATGRTVPASIHVAESPAFLDPNARPAHSQVWLDNIPTIRPLPLLRDWPELEELANEELQHAYYETGDASGAVHEIVERGARYLGG
jgi:multiple sugar transport system substrate-binding protein